MHFVWDIQSSAKFLFTCTCMHKHKSISGKTVFMLVCHVDSERTPVHASITSWRKLRDAIERCFTLSNQRCRRINNRATLTFSFGKFLTSMSPRRSTETEGCSMSADVRSHWCGWTCWTILYCWKKASRLLRRAECRFCSRRECSRESRGSHYNVCSVQKIASAVEIRCQPSRTIVALAILIYTDGRSVAGYPRRDVLMRRAVCSCARQVATWVLRHSSDNVICR